MIQNSLEQLFNGIESTLIEVVVPALEDEYARAQVKAAVEILANISTRVEWRCSQLQALIIRIRQVLLYANELAPEGVRELNATRELLAAYNPEALDNEALVAARLAHLSALAQVQVWLGKEGSAGKVGIEGLREQIADLIIWQIDDEFACLRTGMYREGK